MPDDSEYADQIPFNINSMTIDTILHRIDETMVNSHKIGDGSITLTVQELGGDDRYVQLPNSSVNNIISNWALAETKPMYSYIELTDRPYIPTKLGDLTNDVNYITIEEVEEKNYTTLNEVNNQGFLKAFTETDPTVPSWAKQPTKPTYTIDEINGLQTEINTLRIQIQALQNKIEELEGSNT